LEQEPVGLEYLTHNHQLHLYTAHTPPP